MNSPPQHPLHLPEHCNCPHQLLLGEHKLFVEGSVLLFQEGTTQGVAGPSGIDAAGWLRLCTSFGKESTDMCNAIAAVAHRLSTDYVDPSGLQAFLVCRLIPLDKRPGVRPIGICEVLRRIIGEAVMEVEDGFYDSCWWRPAMCW